MNKDTLRARDYMVTTLHSVMDKAFANDGLEHLVMVAWQAQQLAKQRGLNEDFALIAGYLHDLATYTTHYGQDHAKRSALLVQPFLEEKTTLAKEDVDTILLMISKHSDKEVFTDPPLCELLKDADAISHVLMLGYDFVSEIEKQRFDLNNQ